MKKNTLEKVMKMLTKMESSVIKLYKNYLRIGYGTNGKGVLTLSIVSILNEVVEKAKADGAEISNEDLEELKVIVEKQVEQWIANIKIEEKIA